MIFALSGTLRKARVVGTYGATAKLLDNAAVRDGLTDHRDMSSFRAASPRITPATSQRIMWDSVGLTKSYSRQSGEDTVIDLTMALENSLLADIEQDPGRSVQFLGCQRRGGAKPCGAAFYQSVKLSSMEVYGLRLSLLRGKTDGM